MSAFVSTLENEQYTLLSQLSSRELKTLMYGLTGHWRWGEELLSVTPIE